MAPLDADGHEHANPDNIDDLSIKDGELYWRKQKVKTETRQKLVLSFWQKVAAGIVSIAVTVAAVLTPVSQYVADLDKVCTNTSYSAPYCQTWKTTHDAEEKTRRDAEELRAKSKPPDTTVTDKKPVIEPPPAPPLPVKGPTSSAADQKTTVPVTVDETELDCGEGDSYKIGPFADGNAGDTSIKPDEKLLAKLNENIEPLVGKLTKNHLGQRPLGLILVGSADKRELKPPLFHLFGSNAGLAQARAEWVRKAIENSSMRPKPKTILTLSSGPAHVGQDPLPEKDLAEDRSVRVCAIWGSK